MVDGRKVVTGPAEANIVGADYAIGYVSASGAPVMTSVGIRLPVDGTPDDVRAADTVLAHFDPGFRRTDFVELIKSSAWPE